MDVSQPWAKTANKYFYLKQGAVGLNKTPLTVRMHKRVAAAGSERKILTACSEH